MAPSAAIAHYRGKTAGLTRSRTSDDPELVEARRDLAAERLAEYIARTLETAPPLTPEQRDRLALLLRPAGQRTDASPAA
jgi:hypothetical protein